MDLVKAYAILCLYACSSGYRISPFIPYLLNTYNFSSWTKMTSYSFKNTEACFAPGPAQTLEIEQWIKQQKPLLWWNLCLMWKTDNKVNQIIYHIYVNRRIIWQMVRKIKQRRPIRYFFMCNLHKVVKDFLRKVRERKAVRIYGEEHSKQREQQIRLWGRGVFLMWKRVREPVFKAGWVRGRLRPDIIKLQQPSKDCGTDSDVIKSYWSICL